jgi:folate-binding protein YgfZ
MQPNLLTPGVIKFSGQDAEKFLQGQLTCDVRLAHESHPILGALCNNKGRVIASFWLSKQADTYYMLLPREMVAIVMPILKKYGQFSNIVIEVHSVPPHPIPSLAECIKSGFAVVLPHTTGQFTPHELAYPQIGAVSFDKGCYTGQEIVARMHYRGKAKQHLIHITFNKELAELSLNVINISKVNTHYEALIVASDVSLPDIKVLKHYA